MNILSPRILALCFAALAYPHGILAEAQTPAASALEVAEAVSVTILSSNLASGSTIGEWGLSVLVEVDGRCVLFDTGRYPDTVLRNAKELDVDLSCVTDVVLSHFHADHTGGLLPLLRELRARNPRAIRRVHVARGFFLPRRAPTRTGETERNQMIALKDTLEEGGVEFVEHTEPSEILPAIWITGPVKRPNAEKNYGNTMQVRINGEWVEDYVPDSQALTVITPRGHIVLLGCGHSGVVNVLEYIREIGVEHLMAGHCTGIEPLLRLRTGLNLSRRTAVVGAVGSQFVYGEGIRPTAIAM